MVVFKRIKATDQRPDLPRQNAPFLSQEQAIPRVIPGLSAFVAESANPAVSCRIGPQDIIGRAVITIYPAVFIKVAMSDQTGDTVEVAEGEENAGALAAGHALPGAAGAQAPGAIIRRARPAGHGHVLQSG
jgi:hypothetical protein